MSAAAFLHIYHGGLLSWTLQRSRGSSAPRTVGMLASHVVASCPVAAGVVVLFRGGGLVFLVKVIRNPGSTDS